MKPMINKRIHQLHHVVNGERVAGPHTNMTGVTSNLYGDVTNIRGDVGGLWGDASNVSGDVTSIWGCVTELSGNFDECGITAGERSSPIPIRLLVIDHLFS